MVILLLTKVKTIVKKVWKPIFITILVFVTVSFAATKVVYDSLFRRYDPQENIPVAQEILEKREEVFFPCEDVELRGYYYAGTKKDVLVVVAPGFHAGGDDYLEQIRWFLNCGWGVFAFDTTGSCESGGKSSVGFPQEVLDLEAALHYLDQNQRFDYKNLVLFGHSRGGYAVCCALSSEFDIDAVISVGGINSAMEGIMEPLAETIGPIAYVNYPFLWAYQSLIFGRQTVNLDAAEILDETHTPTLIIHGKNDEKVSYDAYSIISYREEIQSDCVEYFTADTPGSDGHTDLLFNADGTANDELMTQVEEFILRHTKK